MAPRRGKGTEWKGNPANREPRFAFHCQRALPRGVPRVFLVHGLVSDLKTVFSFREGQRAGL